jgi:hypothetical protein
MLLNYTTLKGTKNKINTVQIEYYNIKQYNLNVLWNEHSTNMARNRQNWTNESEIT